jgi:hypothetical protein
MPINSGRYFANPAIGKAHEKSAESDKKAMPQEPTGGEGHSHPPAHTVTIHKAGGKFHTTGHHDQGAHTAEHDSQDAAFGHAKGCMDCGPGGESDSGGMQDFMGGMK